MILYYFLFGPWQKSVCTKVYYYYIVIIFLENCHVLLLETRFINTKPKHHIKYPNQDPSVQ